MDQVLQQLGIEHIFSTSYHPQSNGMEFRSLSQIPQTHPEEAMQKESIKFGQMYKQSSHKLQSDTKPFHN